MKRYPSAPTPAGACARRRWGFAQAAEPQRSAPLNQKVRVYPWLALLYLLLAFKYDTISFILTGQGTETEVEQEQPRIPQHEILLNEQRELIDMIDRELVELINRRSAVALEVGRIKMEHGLPIFVGSREEQVLQK